jgi:hypothetical protein
LWTSRIAGAPAKSPQQRPNHEIRASILAIR